MSTPQTDARRTAFLLGASTLIAQAVLLREAMAAMGGSEMAWGFVMALWLVGMGCGARLGAHVGSITMAGWLPVVVLVFAGGGVVALRAAPAMLGLSTGEPMNSAGALWLWALVVLPSSVAGGLSFPVLAKKLGGSGGRAYSFEATGALVGGLSLSFLLIGFGSAAALTFSLGAVAAASIWRRHRLIACVFVLGGSAAALPAGSILADAGWQWRGLSGTLAKWQETRLQRIEMTSGEPASIYGDGRLIASYPDPYSTLPRSHLLMLVHPNPRRIFTIGCAGDGSIEAMLRHPIDSLVVVEEDPDFLAVIPSWYGHSMKSALADPRVHPITSDPLRALSQSGVFDLILLNDPDPTSLRRNRTRTLEFFRSCRTHLDPRGILIVSLNVSDTYLGGAAGRLISTIAATLREVFPQTKIIPGQKILLMAGGADADFDLDPTTLIQRLSDRRLDRSELIPEMIPVLLDRDRSREIEDQLDRGAPPNTVNHPRAVLLAGGLHEGRSQPGLLSSVLALERAGVRPFVLSASLAVFLLLIPTVMGRATAFSTAVVVGFGSMGWWLILMAIWQMSRGSVFSEIGALTAVFMGGLAIGSALAAKLAEPQRSLPAIFAAMVTMSVLIAAGTAVYFPLVGVPLMLVLGGLLTGAAFPGVVQLTGREARRGAGSIFAGDEFGAAGAALAVGIFAIPLFGLTATAAALAVFQLAALPSILVALRKLRRGKMSA